MKNEKQPLAMHLSKRCGAMSKRTGLPCRGPAMKNGRCRLHGGKSTGPPLGNQNALKHGLFTSTMLSRHKDIKEFLRGSKKLISEISIAVIDCKS